MWISVANGDLLGRQEGGGDLVAGRLVAGQLDARARVGPQGAVLHGDGEAGA
jgi:hypothetical protein